MTPEMPHRETDEVFGILTKGRRLILRKQFKFVPNRAEKICRSSTWRRLGNHGNNNSKKIYTYKK